MSAGATRFPRLSPTALARVGGLLYVLIIAGGLAGEAVVRGGVIVPDDPAATAENLRASEATWRVALAGEILMLVMTLVLAVILFVLLRPASPTLALLALSLNLVTVAIEAGNELRLINALLPLTSPGAIAPAQAEALASIVLAEYSYGFGVSLIFFGVECLVLGALLSVSGYLPRAIGVMMAIAGTCYLLNSLALLAAPTLADVLFPAILAPAFLGEVVFALWLLVKGVHGPAFAERLRESRSPPFPVA